MRRNKTFIAALGASVSFASPVLAQNAVNNGSFEGPTGAPPVGWTVSGTASDGYLPVAIAYGQASGYPNGAQGEVVPQDNAPSKSPDPAGQNAVYLVSDAAVNLTLSQKVYLNAGSHEIGFDSYDTFNGAQQKYDAELTATIAGVKLADFFASTVQPGIWTTHAGEAYVSQAGYYDVDFVFNADTFPAKDILIDRVYVINVVGDGGTPIGGSPPPSAVFNYWDGDAAGNANNSVIDGGNGVWNATATNWTTADGSANGAYNPNPGTVTFAGTGGTVTVDDSLGAISVTGMNFTVDGYHIVGDAIGLSGDTATFSVGNGGEGDASITATIDSVLTGSSGLAKTGAGTLVLNGVNTYTGGTTISAGTLIGSATSFGSGPVVNDGANFVIDQPTDAAFGNTIAGTGTFLKVGEGTLTLNGSNAFTGSTGVGEGTLLVDGTLAGSNVTIASGATLGGTGIVGGIVAQSGATVAIGSTIGTLGVAGNYSAAAGSAYAVKLMSTGQSDLLNIAGTAAITPGANLVVTKLDDARYVLGERYTVLTAVGGTTGGYTVSGDTHVSLFYNVVADYDPTHVYLDVKQTSSFASAGVTPNQIAAAGGADSKTGGLHDAIGYLQTTGEAQQAFDSISGEIYASERAVAFEDSRFVREAVYGRLNDTSDAKGLWMHGFGSWGHMRSDGNAARYQRDTGGFFLGVDLINQGSARFGLLVGYGHGSLKVPDRASHATSDDAYLGAYAGFGSGNLALNLGASYKFDSLATSRGVGFTGFTDSLDSHYNLNVGQVFGEVGYKIPLGPAFLEPIASAAWVSVDSNRNSENGGLSQLTINAETSHVVFTNLGGRFGADVGKLKLFGAASWRHASGDRDVRVTMAFDGGDDFSVAAAPIAKDVAALELGGQVAIAKNASFAVSYSGESGNGLSDNGVKAALRWAF